MEIDLQKTSIDLINSFHIRQESLGLIPSDRSSTRTRNRLAVQMFANLLARIERGRERGETR